MKHRSKKPKPPVGMEMTVTLSMAADKTVPENAEALMKFFEEVSRASNAVGAAWVKVHCAGIPDELEAAMQGAFDKIKNPAGLRVVVDNSSSNGQSEDRE